MTPERSAIAVKLARDWPEGICRYCAIAEERVDGDRIRWLGRRRTVCNQPGCVRKFGLDIDRAEKADRRAKRKRTPAEIHELILDEKRRKRPASRERSRQRKKAAACGALASGECEPCARADAAHHALRAATLYAALPRVEPAGASSVIGNAARVDRSLLGAAFVRLKTQDMAACIGEIDDVESRKADANKAFRRELAELDERMRRIAHQVRTRTESRMVSCEITFHQPQLGYKRTVRLDTGEIVREEPMTDEERDSRLFEEPDRAAQIAPPDELPLNDEQDEEL